MSYLRVAAGILATPRLTDWRPPQIRDPFGSPLTSFQIWPFDKACFSPIAQADCIVRGETL